MARLDDVLAHNIESYLNWDVTSMSCNDADGRGVGYPLIMTASAGIEFLGALLSPVPFQSRGQSRANFVRYWTDYLYPAPDPRSAFAALAYELARCGIAHGFLLKGQLRVSRHEPALHLKRDANDKFVIDAVELARDVIESYRLRVSPLLSDPKKLAQRVQMETRLKQMEDTYEDEGTKHQAVVAGAQQVAITTSVVSAPVLTPFVSGALPNALPPGSSGSGASGAV